VPDHIKLQSYCKQSKLGKLQIAGRGLPRIVKTKSADVSAGAEIVASLTEKKFLSLAKGRVLRVHLFPPDSCSRRASRSPSTQRSETLLPSTLNSAAPTHSTRLRVAG
jgi:hypothetical protein